jgi:hypothetical protein
MQAEAVKRNKELKDEDRAKNLVWAVIGRRGDKRLVKRFADREVDRTRVTRGRGRATRGVEPPTRGKGGQPTRGRGRVAEGVYGPEAGVYRPEAVEDGEEVQEVGARTRLNSKRTRPEEEDEEDMPVAKQ